MAKLLKLRRGTTSQHNSFTGAEGEVTVDTDKNTLVVHDGSTQGGFPLHKAASALNLIDEDNMATDSATRPPSQQSVKAYVDASALSLIDEDNMSTDSATRPPSQQSVKAYVDAIPDVIDEDNMATNSATRPPSQQSVKAYVDLKAPLASPALTGTATAVNLTISGNLTVNGTTTTVESTTMTVADKNIEIAKGAANDAAADGAGITVDSGDGDKTWNWVDATDAWTSSEHIALPAGKRILLGTTTEGHSNADDLTIANSANCGITIRSGTSNDGNIFFSDATSGGGETTGTLKYSHTNNSFTFNTNGTTALTINSSQNATFAGTVADSKGNVRSIPQNTQGSTYTLVAADAGKHILASGAVTVPNSVFSAGDAVTIVNNTGGDLTITKTITTMYLATDGTSANRTLATRGVATILFASGTVAYISGAGLS